MYVRPDAVEVQVHGVTGRKSAHINGKILVDHVSRRIRLKPARIVFAVVKVCALAGIESESDFHVVRVVNGGVLQLQAVVQDRSGGIPIDHVADRVVHAVDAERAEIGDWRVFCLGNDRRRKVVRAGDAALLAVKQRVERERVIAGDDA